MSIKLVWVMIMPTWISSFMIKIIAGLLIFSGYSFYLWNSGSNYREKKYEDQKKVEMLLETNSRIIKTDEVLKDFVVTVERVSIVKERTRKIKKEIPTHVTKEDDDKCTIGAGFIKLYNDSASTPAY